VESAGPPPPGAPPEPSGVKWHQNALVAPLRRGALVSFAIGVTMLLLASSSMVTGEVTIFTIVLVFLMFYFTDNAMGRFFMAQRAPREVGLWGGGVIIRGSKREDAFRWEELREIAVTPVAGRFSVLTLRTWRGEAKSYTGVPPSLASEIKVSSLEAQARRGGGRAGAAIPPARRAAAASATGLAPAARLEPSRTPSFWRPAPPDLGWAPLPAAPAAPASSEPGTPPLPLASPPAARAAPPPAPPVPPPARPEWSFTRIGAGEPTPDPRYPVRQGSVESFRWHFIPTAGSQTGAWLLLAVVVLASIVISRITADLALSLLGLASDPWTATGIGLAVGLGIALVFYRMARGEIAGEVAGSVIFLPMFDRTKADIADSLREAGQALDAGDARMRESRGRLILTWPQARTRAIVMQASQESRAILLRTVGRARYGLHQRFKGAILERLRAGSVDPPVPPARR